MSISQNYPLTSPSLSLDFANTKVLDPRITFSRPTDAVYYDGKTVTKAEENLLAYSQDFDNDYWPKNSVTIVSNTSVAPDGTTTAEVFSEGTDTDIHFFRSPIFSPNTYTFSIYIKNVDMNFVGLSVHNNNSSLYANAVFDLTNQTISTSAVGVGFSIEATSITESPVGSGWYRCVMTATSSNSTFYPIIYSSNSATAGIIPSFTGTNRTALVWGAQLEARDTVTAYTPTTTQAITNYIPTLLTAPSNVARFDHNPVTGESLGLLVEEQRTNLVTYSEEFDNAAWGVKSNSSITANTLVSPDGTLSGDKLVENTASGQHWVGGNTGATITSGVSYTISVYAKQAERGYFQFYGDAGGGRLTTGAVFNLTNGTVYSTVSGATSSITSVGNGWYRCSVTATASSTGSSYLYIGLRQNSSPATDSYTGDGYSGIYIWGAQLEAGAFPTSYIKTQASQVTRSADSASMTGTNFSDWYRQDEGTLYVEAFTVEPSGFTAGICGVNDGTVNNSLQLNYSSTYNRLEVNSNGTSQASLDISRSAPNIFGKFSYSAKVNDFIFASDGTLSATDTFGFLPPSVNSFQIGGINIDAIRNLNGCIRKISYYPQRLTNTQLQALTS
jgi:hypothetical protein